MVRGSKISAASFWMFVIALGGQTQVHFFGSIGISELPIYLLAPIIFIKDFQALKRDGFLPWIWLSILTCAGCVVSSLVNGIPFIFMLKGLATPYSIFAVSIVFHRLIRQDFMSYKWFLVGFFLSGIICTFVFQPESYIVSGGGIAQGEEAFERMITHPLYWTSRISVLLRLPVCGWYMSMPRFVSCLFVMSAGIVAILYSRTSGRGSFGIAVAITGLIILGGKSKRTLRMLGNNLWIFSLCGLLAIAGIRIAYKYAALSGFLGEDARVKYYKQTANGESMIRILLSGRKEFFIAMTAAVDKPILGHGPKAEDTKGYVNDFLFKYGDAEDYYGYLKDVESNLRKGIGYYIIPTHSYLGAFWVHYGIVGLILWLYVLWIIWRYFRFYAAVVPQWFGFLSVTFMGMLWAIFFSPYGDRFSPVLSIVCALFAKAVYERRFELPVQLEAGFRGA